MMIDSELMNRQSRTKKVLTVFFICLSIHGLIGFMCFLLEESMQTNMFAAFAYQSANDWDGLEKHIKLMEDTHDVSELMIVSIGWLAPVTYPAYLQYLKVNEGYIKAMKKRVSVEKFRQH